MSRKCIECGVDIYTGGMPFCGLHVLTSSFWKTGWESWDSSQESKVYEKFVRDGQDELADLVFREWWKNNG